MSLNKIIGMVAVTIGLLLLYCGKDTKQPEMNTTSSDDRTHAESRKSTFSTTRSQQPTTTAVPENPPGTERADSEDFFSTALSRQRKKDYKGAIELFERACAEGQSTACYQLGVIYRDGIGVAVNERRAHSWFQIACQKDNVAACDALGH